MALRTTADQAAIETAYRARTARSARLFERAAVSLPGGSTRTTVFFHPYPPYIACGRGAGVVDIDGNEYVDFLNNYTSLILGHADERVVAAVTRQVALGSAYGAPTELEVELAEELCGRVRSVDELRFTNSGTEATMFALRLARVFTGREVIAKFEGSYHGTHDTAFAGTAGVPRSMSETVIELPYNDRAGVEARLAGRESSVAAIIIEPVLGAGGMHPASAEFLAFLRAFTERHAMLLVFDEIIAFRIAHGGAQAVYGVAPDLTTFGKIIGGGYALAAFGGRRDVMERLNATRTGSLAHGGTFNGNPVAAAAGLATLRAMTPDRYEELNARGDGLRNALNRAFRERALDAEVTGAGSLFNVHLGRASGDQALSAAIQARFHLAMLVNGWYLAPRGMGALSTPMTQADVDGFVAAAADVAEAALGGSGS